MAARQVTLFLCGDVMTGRGVDQILRHPAGPQLREPYVRDAREYVALAERASGPIPRPAGDAWVWGDALPELAARKPAARLVNLETSITAGGEFAPGKDIHYRMHPANIGCLAVARPDACVLANNHVLDFGRAGLSDTLDALAGAGLRAVGAGRDGAAARRPAVIGLPGGGRVLVFACGTASAGIPPGWAAGPGRPGIDYLARPTATAAAALAARIQAVRRPGDLVVVSLHWGSNWGYQVPGDQVAFARRLAAGGADVVFGHSSHHPRPIEVHQGKLILYGCGDFIDDYEGIRGYEEYRDDLRLMYFATLTAGTGALAALEMVPLQARNMRLRRAGQADARWLADLLTRISRPSGCRAALAPDGTIRLLTDGPAAGRGAVANS
ncbi:MAG: CapA family protein [Gemmatimonadota bacterium]